MEPPHSLSERRIAARIDVARPVAVDVDGERRDAVTVNVSTSGMLVAVEGTLTIWADVVLALPGLGERPARVVRRDGERYGLVLREALSREEFACFTGISVVEEAPEPAPVETGPARRIAPWAFGRDRIKSFRRRAAEGLRPKG